MNSNLYSIVGPTTAICAGYLVMRRLSNFPGVPALGHVLLNILKGEMSWIEPRPEACSLSQWYQGEFAFYPYRHIVHPSITGWAQVNQGHVTAPDAVLEKTLL